MRLCCMLLDYYIHLNGLSHTDLAHHELESNFVGILLLLLLLFLLSFSIIIVIIVIPVANICNLPLQVYKTEAAQMSWFYLKLAGYTMMVFVRFDDIMGDTEPVARIDALHMFLALAAAIGVTVPLAKLKSFDAAPPTAVIVAGGVYLALHLVRKWMRQIKQARKDKQ